MSKCFVVMWMVKLYLYYFPPFLDCESSQSEREVSRAVENTDCGFRKIYSVPTRLELVAPTQRVRFLFCCFMFYCPLVFYYVLLPFFIMLYCPFVVLLCFIAPLLLCYAFYPSDRFLFCCFMLYCPSLSNWYHWTSSSSLAFHDKLIKTVSVIFFDNRLYHHWI